MAKILEGIKFIVKVISLAKTIYDLSKYAYTNLTESKESQEKINKVIEKAEKLGIDIPKIDLK